MYKFRELQGKEVVVFLTDGTHIHTYLKTVLSALGRLEILKEQAMLTILDNPKVEKMVLGSHFNYSFIQLTDVLDIQQV